MTAATFIYKSAFSTRKKGGLPKKIVLERANSLNLGEFPRPMRRRLTQREGEPTWGKSNGGNACLGRRKRGRERESTFRCQILFSPILGEEEGRRKQLLHRTTTNRVTTAQKSTTMAAAATMSPSLPESRPAASTPRQPSRCCPLLPDWCFIGGGGGGKGSRYLLIPCS